MKTLRRVCLGLLVLIAIAGGCRRRDPRSSRQRARVDIEGSYVESAEPPLLARLASQPPRPLARCSPSSRSPSATRGSRRSCCACARSTIGWAKAQEIRDAIARLGEHGRRTIAYLELESFGGNLEYYVASAAQELFVSEATRAPLIGLAGEFLFFGGLFEKLGIEFEVERVGSTRARPRRSRAAR
jgi:protease-4